MQIEQQTFLKTILDSIEDDTLELPTLPDVAIKIQALIDDPNAPADQLVSALIGDPVISAQLIKSANSAAYFGKHPIDNVRGAIARLGYHKVRNLVMGITLNKMASSKTSFIGNQLKSILEHSKEVAVVSYVLTTRQPLLSPDQAMLGGLVHEIGTLPLCMHLEKKQMELTTEALLALIQNCSAKIGAKLLKKWNFPSDLITLTEEHEHLQRESANMPNADYTDVITIANLLCGTPQQNISWSQVSAAPRLGLTADEWDAFMSVNAEHIARVAELLNFASSNREQNKFHDSKSNQFDKKNRDSFQNNEAGLWSTLKSWLLFFRRH